MNHYLFKRKVYMNAEYDKAEKEDYETYLADDLVEAWKKAREAIPDCNYKFIEGISIRLMGVAEVAKGI